MASTNIIRLKLLIDSKSRRVLFAEASKDFVDFLFNLLSLPVGTVIRLLTKKGMVGCLGNLYDSIEKLTDTYMQPNLKKDALLNPKIPNTHLSVPLLLPPSIKSSTRKFYKCAYYNNYYSNCGAYVADDPRAICPDCKTVMSCEASYVAPPVEDIASSSKEGGFVKGVVTYMLMDDLVVIPMSTISSITMLKKFNIKDVGVLEEKVVNFGMGEGVKLLKASLQSKTVLTDVFLGPNGRKRKWK
ncbi:DUF674 domain-containing protein [Cephalotus follicularis]|uniref:DUF674 domain-containing protein n=1 Tax=Cephalotus follicularis TaxID=3775 RepID=A0A1Q3CA01_CEPFO|nr:DUF674 domain-containing protein [Cephalotus follicularis]